MKKKIKIFFFLQLISQTAILPFSAILRGLEEFSPLALFSPLLSSPSPSSSFPPFPSRFATDRKWRGPEEENEGGKRRRDQFSCLAIKSLAAWPVNCSTETEYFFSVPIQRYPEGIKKVPAQ